MEKKFFEREREREGGLFCCRAYTVLRATSSPPRTSHRYTDGCHTVTPRTIFDPDRCHSVTRACSTQWPPLINPKNDVATQVTQACRQTLTPRRRPHTPPSGINYALKLLLAFETRECLSLVLGSVFGGRSAPG